jgi:pentatricopeptide repeat protein
MSHHSSTARTQYARRVWDSYKQSEVGDSDRANATWVVWEEMKERGVKANETAFFNMMLKATRDMDNYDRTKKTFEDMMKAGVKPNMESIELMMHDSLRNHDKATFDAISMLVKSQKSLLQPEFTQYLQDNPDASADVKKQAEEYMGADFMGMAQDMLKKGDQSGFPTNRGGKWT